MKEIIELLENKKLNDIKAILIDMNDFDIAEILNEIEDKYLVSLFRLLNKDQAANVFSYLYIDLQQLLITKLSDIEQVNIIKNI